MASTVILQPCSSQFPCFLASYSQIKTFIVDLLKTRLQQRDGLLELRFVVNARTMFVLLSKPFQDRNPACFVLREMFLLQMAQSVFGEEQSLRSSGTYSNACTINSKSLRYTRNVPGVAMYMTTLTHARAALARTSLFVAVPAPAVVVNGNNSSNSVLPKLSSPGNLLAGAATRVTIGFVLNPFSVLKARFEVCSCRE